MKSSVVFRAFAVSDVVSAACLLAECCHHPPREVQQAAAAHSSLPQPLATTSLCSVPVDLPPLNMKLRKKYQIGSLYHIINKN